jgi:23S rRNA (uracil1939-C5)-methyltransferase
MTRRTLEATIGELSPGGEGVAICVIDGERRAVFVPGVLEGERVRVEVDTSRRPARGRILAVLEPAAARVAPPCRHLERCGGCDWMHVGTGAQAREHARIVARLLERPVDEVVAHSAPRTEGYRVRARVHVEARGSRVDVGMFARGSREPVAVDTCVVLDPVLDRVRAGLPALLEGARGRGEAALSLGDPARAPRAAVVDLRWKGDLPAPVFGRFERAVVAGALGGVRIFQGDVKTPARIGDPTPFIVAADGAPLRLAAGGFSQASEDGNALLAARVAALAAELDPADRAGPPAVELFAGAGNLTVLLARERDVVAVERDADACVAARANLAARGLAARVVEADASSFPVPKATRLVVLDPPREGARAVVERLAGARASRTAVLYVACDPPTLARDVRILTAAGWGLRAVETFEMFPHTSHVETVVALAAPRR